MDDVEVTEEDRQRGHQLAVDYFSESNEPPSKASLGRFIAAAIAKARVAGEARGAVRENEECDNIASFYFVIAHVSGNSSALKITKEIAERIAARRGVK